MARVVLLSKIIKLVQSSIMLLVNMPGQRQGFTKMQDEQAYSMMIEDFCKFALRKKSVYLMKLVPSLMHAGFLSPKTFEGICRSFASLLENKDDKLTEDEVSMIRVCCLDAVKAKWADKTKLKKENPQPQMENAFSNQEVKNERVDQEEEELVASL